MEKQETQFTAAAFYRFLADRKLMGTHCRDCGGLYLPPRAICPQCHSSSMDWYEFSGQGELAAFTSVFIGPARMSAAGYTRDNPYLTGIVRLAEGPMISARLIGLPADDPASIQIGAPVRVAFLHEESAHGGAANTGSVLAFEPAD